MKKLMVMAIMLAGCGRGWSPTVATDPIQADVQAATLSYAALLGLKVEVNFSHDAPLTKTPDPVHGGFLPAAGWVTCGEGKHHTINFNADDLERTGATYYKAVGAHEVCHVWYKEDIWPCLADETRATVCGTNLQRGVLPEGVGR